MKRFYLGVVPARGGSKRLPGKNIRMLCGKPMILWTLEACRASAYLDTFLVSTDSKRIRDVCLANAGPVPFLRPKELAQDRTPTADVLIHACDWWKRETGRDPSHVVTLQPTSPLRTSREIDMSILANEYMVLGRDAGVFTANPANPNRPNGAVYVTPIEMLRQDRLVWTLFFDTYLTEGPMPDVDTLEDFEEAEKLLCRRHS